jgi:Putative zinc-finger
MDALARDELNGAEHLSTNGLLAYHRGELPPAESAAVREHLSLCPECAAAVLDAADFFADDEEDEEGGPSADLEARWRNLRAALGRPEERPPFQAAPAPPHRRSLVRSLPFAYGLAAAFAALSISLLFFRGAAPPPRPQANAGLYDLAPVGVERGEGGGGERRSIRFRSPQGSALLILNPAVTSRYPRHGARIRRTDGTVVWSSEDLVPQQPGGFYLSLPAGALPAGDYSIELYGIAEGGETPLGTYPIAIEK